MRPYRTYFDKYLNPPQTVIGPPTRGRPGPSDNDDDEEEDADDGDDDYMVGLETWWGKRAARAGRASMTNPQATLPYTDQVHLVDLYKGIGLRVLLYTNVMANWPPLYTQTSTSLSTQQTRVLLFFTNIMVDSSLDGDRHPCLLIIIINNMLLYETHRCPQYQYVRRCLEYCPCKLLSH